MFHLLCSFALVLIINIVVVCNQSVQSPCPDIFNYEYDGSRIYGKIILRGQNPVSQLDLQASFAVVGYLSDYGRIELENPMYALQSYNRGLPMQYRVHFAPTSQIPILTAITVNGKIVCSGANLIPRPNQAVTNYNLKQSSYLQRPGQAFGVVQSQPSQYNILSSILGDHETNSQEGDENPFNALNNVYNKQVVQDGPVIIKEVRPLGILRPTTTQKPKQEASFNQFVPEDTFQPLEPVAQRQQLPPRQSQYEPPVECGTRASIHDRLALVIDGKNYMRGDLPWLVAIYVKKGNSLSFICAGTLVSNRHVITAAHCMRHGNEKPTINDLVVKVGVHKLDDWGDEITVTRTLIDAAIHESFNASTLLNDILVLTFSKKVNFNAFIRPACLWTGDTALDRIVGDSGIVAGWGTRRNGDAGVGEPQLVKVPIVTREMCRSSNIAFYKRTSEKSFCAGDRNGSGPCTGDSGGGLYLSDSGKWRLRGIVSFSLRSFDGSCNLDDYVVFTDTAKYLPWIRQVLSKEY